MNRRARGCDVFPDWPRRGGAWGKASLDSRASAELRCKIGRSSPKRNRHLEGTGSFAFHTPIRRSRPRRRHPLRPVPPAHFRPACGRAEAGTASRGAAFGRSPARPPRPFASPRPFRPPRPRRSPEADGSYAGALPSFSGNGSFSTSRSMNSSIRRNLPCSFSLTKVSARPVA